MDALKYITPKFFTTIKDYSKGQFIKDLIAGVIVAIIALPLSIALAIASGVNPEQGLYTAVVAGFFISFLGVIIQVTCGLQHYVWGWLWGIFIMVLYLLSLALHGQSIVSGDPYKAVRKSRRQMIWRLMLVGSLVVLGLKIPGVEAVSMFIGIALIQPALYAVYWWLSRQF